MENYTHSYEIESMNTDDIADAIRDAMLGIAALKAAAAPVIMRYNQLKTCNEVSAQAERACRLTEPQDLPADIRGIYLIDPELPNNYSTDSTLTIGVQECAYSHFGKIGTATVSGMSAMRFNTTRQNTPTSQHNFGRAFDVKLQGRMKSNGAAYDRMACACLCLYCVEVGATKVFFSDQAVVDAINSATAKNVCSNISGHENHIHMDCR